MNLGNKSRRWWSLLFLSSAACMLTWGQFLFETYLPKGGLFYLFFWSAALLLCFSSIRLAIIEVLAVKQGYQARKNAILQKWESIPANLHKLNQKN